MIALMKIGELARETGVAAKTIRFYEGSGVLPPPRRDLNGYRNYDASSIDRLNFVRDAQSAGLTLKEIAEVLELRDRGEATCRHTTMLLESHLAEVERQIVDLERMRSQLETMTRRARSLDPERCTDPNRCQTISAS